jgi:hypothetical protein
MPKRKPKGGVQSTPLGTLLLPEEVKCLEQSTRCTCCKHLIVLHHVDTDGYDSFCSIEDCECCYDQESMEWVMEEKE